jgi:hypothetical protein
MSAFIYIRRDSKLEAADDRYSLTNQLMRCKELSETHGIKVKKILEHREVTSRGLGKEFRLGVGSIRGRL